jgi:large subunit ribosomal protein L29
MKLADITSKTDKELTVLVAESRKQLADLAVEMRTKQVANVKQIRATRRTIARALTLLRQRELATAAPAPATQAPAQPAEPQKEENHG